MLGLAVARECKPSQTYESTFILPCFLALYLRVGTAWTSVWKCDCWQNANLTEIFCTSIDVLWYPERILLQYWHPMIFRRYFSTVLTPFDIQKAFYCILKMNECVRLQKGMVWRWSHKKFKFITLLAEILPLQIFTFCSWFGLLPNNDSNNVTKSNCFNCCVLNMLGNSAYSNASESVYIVASIRKRNNDAVCHCYAFFKEVWILM
jgi:hypothetical protein